MGRTDPTRTPKRKGPTWISGEGFRNILYRGVYHLVACKAIRTTREEAFPERIKNSREAKRKKRRHEWQEQEKKRLAKGRQARPEPKFKLPNLTAEERNAAKRGIRSYSILDYLYRLRIRTNYGDAAMFTDGPENDADSEIVRIALTGIVSTSLFAAELILTTAHDGRDKLRAWAEQWADANVPREIDYGVKQRMTLW